MAVTITSIATGQSRLKVFSVIKTADGDSTATIAHLLPYAPEIVTFIPMGIKFYTLQTPIVTTIDATNVTLTLGTGGGSGDALAHFQVVIEAPHSVTD